MNAMLDAVLATNGKCREKGAFRNLRDFLDESLDTLFAAEDYCVFSDDGKTVLNLPTKRLSHFITT